MKKEMLLFAVLSLLALDSSAQKVYKEGSMFIFEAAGMPVGSYTRTLKPRTTDGTDTSWSSRTPENLGSPDCNEKIAYRFEIAGSDNSASSRWLAAVNLCAGLSGGNWRLPTQRELQLIWIMHEKLKTLTGFTAFYASQYRSVTEDGDLNNLYVDFTDGVSHNNGIKTVNSRVRCVRDF